MGRPPHGKNQLIMNKVRGAVIIIPGNNDRDSPQSTFTNNLILGNNLEIRSFPCVEVGNSLQIPTSEGTKAFV